MSVIEQKICMASTQDQVSRNIALGLIKCSAERHYIT